MESMLTKVMVELVIWHNDNKSCNLEIDDLYGIVTSVICGKHITDKRPAWLASFVKDSIPQLISKEKAALIESKLEGYKTLSSDSNDAQLFTYLFSDWLKMFIGMTIKLFSLEIPETWDILRGSYLVPNQVYYKLIGEKSTADLYMCLSQMFTLELDYKKQLYFFGKVAERYKQIEDAYKEECLWKKVRSEDTVEAIVQDLVSYLVS